jgi:hypothetical protein
MMEESRSQELADCFAQIQRCFSEIPEIREAYPDAVRTFVKAAHTELTERISSATTTAVPTARGKRIVAETTETQPSKRQEQTSPYLSQQLNTIAASAGRQTFYSPEDIDLYFEKELQSFDILCDKYKCSEEKKGIRANIIVDRILVAKREAERLITQKNKEVKEIFGYGSRWANTINRSLNLIQMQLLEELSRKHGASAESLKEWCLAFDGPLRSPPIPDCYEAWEVTWRVRNTL